MLARIVIAGALAGIAAGRIPIFRMNRASIALLGAVAVVAARGITLDEAFASLDLETLALLFSMMVISVNLRLSGFFRLAGNKIIRVARTPRQLLGLVVLLSGVLSALFLNDTVVLMFTPLVLAVVVELDRNPLPYLIGLAVSANIGSAATIIGNPQNMIIGIASGIDFFRFAGLMIVPSAIGLAAAWLIIAAIFPGEFRFGSFPEIPHRRVQVYRPLLVKSLTATGFFLAGVVAGLPLPFATLLAAVFLLVTRRLRPERVFADIDWSLLVLFSGLFVIIAALRADPSFQVFLDRFMSALSSDSYIFGAAAGLLSNVVSNVPAVMLLRPGIEGIAGAEKSWLVLALSTTYAGNLTLLGSVANLIVAESAKRRGVHLGFMSYLIAGVPITIVSMLIGIAWLEWVL